MKNTVLTLTKSKGRAFLIQRRYGPFEKYWSLPGGGKKPEEDLETTAKRETKEETGLNIKIIEKIDSFIATGDNNRSTRLHIFLCEVDSDNYSIDMEECLDGGWFGKEAYQNMQVIPVLRKYLENAMDREIQA